MRTPGDCLMILFDMYITIRRTPGTGREIRLVTRDNSQPTRQKCSHQQQWLLVQQNEGVVEEENKGLIMNSNQHFGLFCLRLI